MPRAWLRWAVILTLVLVPAALGTLLRRPSTRRAMRWEHVSAAGLRLDRVTDRLQALYAKDGTIYSMEDHFLYISHDSGRSYVRMGRLPKAGSPSLATRVRDMLARTEIVRRFRRYSGPRTLAVLNSGTILVFYDRIYRSTDGGRTFSAVPGTTTKSIPHGFPSSLGVAVGPGDTVYYGEYATTARPHVVRIVRGTGDGLFWDIAYSFPKGMLFHVHSVAYDPYRARYWIAAGDTGQEARLMYTDDGFRTVETAGCCSQDWRLVDLVVTKDALFWGSDDDRREPGIYRYDVEANSLERIGDLKNPSYHAARLSDGTLAITTTFEPASSYSRHQKAPATTSLWVSHNGTDWKRLLSLEGDFAEWDAGLRPQIQLPAGDPLPVLLATPWFTDKWQFSTLRFVSGQTYPTQRDRNQP